MDTVNDTNPPTTPNRPMLTRSTDDKVLAGVSGGLGRYFGIDPLVFRIAFVVLALAGGSGVLLYLVGWLLIADDRGDSAMPRLANARHQKLVAAVLAGIGVLLLADQVTERNGGDAPVGLVLLGIGGLVLWSRRRHDDARPESGPPSFSPPPPFVPPSPPVTDVETSSTPIYHDAPVGPTPPATDPQPRSALVAVTLSSLAILAGGVMLFGVAAQAGLALALLVTGGALVVGARRGRARWLIPLGLVLATALAAVCLVDVPVRGGITDVTYRPAVVDDIRSPYRLAAGHLVLDLGALDLQGATVTVVASVAAGDLEVIVPDGVAVEANTHVGAGKLEVLGRLSDGLDVDRPVTEAGGEGSGRLVVRARAGVGSVEVRRASS